MDYTSLFNKIDEKIISGRGLWNLQDSIKDCKDIFFCEIEHSYWAVISGGEIVLPSLTKTLILSDTNTPDAFAEINRIEVKFAIPLLYDYRSGYYIDYHNKGMSLYPIDMWEDRFTLPFYCSVPFVYEHSNPNRISLESTYNKWIISVIPDLFLKNLSKIPTALLSNKAFSSIVPKPYEGKNLLEIKKIYNSAIYHSTAAFIPKLSEDPNSRVTLLRIDECFTNKTSIIGFDDLIQKYLEIKYSQHYRHTLSSTLYGEVYQRPQFTEEDLVPFILNETISHKIAPEQYAKLLFQLYLSLKHSLNDQHYSQVFARLANSNVLISEDGLYSKPSSLFFDDANIIPNGYYKLHKAFSPFLDIKNNYIAYYDTFREFLSACGVFTLRKATISGNHYTWIEEGFKKTIQFIDDGFQPYKQLDIHLDTLLYNKNRSCPENEFFIGNNQDEENGLLEICFVLSDYPAKEYAGIIDKEKCIIVPFGYGHYQIEYIFQPEFNRIIRQSGYLSGDTIIYSYSGEELFPASNVNLYGKRIVKLLSEKEYILLDNDQSRHRYSILDSGFNDIPFEEEFYSVHGYNYEFIECAKRLIIAESKGQNGDVYSSVIDNKGHVIIKGDWWGILYSTDYELLFSHYNGSLATYSLSGEYLYNIETYPYDHLDYSEGYFFSDRHLPDYLIVRRRYHLNEYKYTNEYYGLISHFRIVIPIICDSLSCIINSYYRAQINSKFGIIHSSGKVTVPPIFDYIIPLNTDGAACNDSGFTHYVLAVTGCHQETVKDRKVFKGGTKQFLSLDGKLLLDGVSFDKITCKYIIQLSAKVWFLKRAIVPGSDIQNGKSGVLDISLNEIVPFRYDFVIYKNGFYLVNDGGQVSIVEGKSIIKGGHWGVFLNSLLVECKYDSVSIINGLYDSTLFRLREKTQMGLANSEGVIVIPIVHSFIFMPTYSHDKEAYLIRVNNGGRFIQEEQRVKGGEWYFYDSKSWSIVSPALPYEYVGDYSFGLSVVEIGGKYGYMNESFEICINCIFDSANNFDWRRQGQVILAGERILIDQWGNQIGVWEEPVSHDEGNRDNDYEGYSQSELEDMYRAAFGGDSSAQWNIE